MFTSEIQGVSQGPQYQKERCQEGTNMSATLKTLQEKRNIFVSSKLERETVKKMLSSLFVQAHERYKYNIYSYEFKWKF